MRNTERAQEKNEMSKLSKEETDTSVPLPPWMNETKARKANRMGPLILNHKNGTNVLHKENSRDSFCGKNEMDQSAPLHSTPSGSSPKAITTSLEINNPSSYSSSPPKIGSSPPKINTSLMKISSSPPKMKDVSEFVPRSPTKQGAIDFVSSSAMKSNKEILQPIKKPEPLSQPITQTDVSQRFHEPMESRDGEENQSEASSRHIIQAGDAPANKANILPPLKAAVKAPVMESKQEGDNLLHTGVMMRKKSAPPTQPKLYRPMTVDASLRMWETPSWKKQLVEKKKKRESLTNLAIEQVHESKEEENNNNNNVPPWQRELDVTKHRKSVPIKGNLGVSPSKDATPDWMKQVQERRRSRLAESGFTEEDEGV